VQEDAGLHWWCPKAIVTDNLKSGVTRASRYEPEVSQSFNDFCNHYGMAVYQPELQAKG